MCSSISNEARDKRHLRHQLKVTNVSYDECALVLDSSPLVPVFGVLLLAAAEVSRDRGFSAADVGAGRSLQNADSVSLHRRTKARLSCQLVFALNPLLPDW